MTVMTPAVRLFKSILLQTCKAWDQKIQSVFDDFHVDDVLDEADRNDLDGKALAALVLWKCCCTQGKFNNASIIFLGVVKLLKDLYGEIGEQPFLDLGAMLKRGTTVEAIQKWIETHYA